jgi:hypothetical protein
MDIDAPLSRIAGRRWPWLMDMHLYYFSKGTLRRMLSEQGYNVVWDGAQGRYLSLGYLASRVAGMNAALGRLTQAMVNALGLRQSAILINFGDLRTFISQRVR